VLPRRRGRRERGGVIEKGEPWGGPARGSPEAEGRGDDAALARLVEGHPNTRLRFDPDHACDLARAIGLTSKSPCATEVSLDALRTDDGTLAVNMIVLGRPPDRLHWWHRRQAVEVRVDGREVYRGNASTVLSANGQYLRGVDVVHRGHPGDGKAEVHIYALQKTERAQMRQRLESGAHIPHPRIKITTGKTIEVTWTRPTRTEMDGRRAAATKQLSVEVRPNVYRLLV